MCNATLIVLDITLIYDSVGLEKELKLALYLVEEGYLHPRHLVIICAHDDRIQALEYVDREFGLASSAVVVVGDPDAKDTEFARLSALARGARGRAK